MIPASEKMTCEKSPKGRHCDHSTGQVLTSYPPRSQFQCCYCGRTYSPEPIMGGSYTPLKPEDHGPYFPQLTRWG